MKNILIALLLLAGCTVKEQSAITTVTTTATETKVATATATEVKVQPAPVPVVQLDCNKILKGIESTCPRAGEYQAVDLATYTDQRFLDVGRCLGWKTIIRYYDWKQESIKGKTPTAEELKRIKASGFDFMAVFQHLNSSYSTFTNKARPAIDLARILELAKLWGQPKGSAVYIGVDGDFYTEEQKAAVRSYFKGITPGLRAAGFKVGMYGSGANCLSLKSAGLIDGDLCWIAASAHGWSGTKQVLASGKYSLAQKVNQKCGGKSLDYNKAQLADFGQWKLP